MNKILKKAMAIILLTVIIFTNMPIYVIAAVDMTSPSVIVSGINSNTVMEEGKSISFIVYFSDETQLGTVNMTKNHVALIGFEGTVGVSGTGNTRTVTISNIKDTTGTNSITIRANAAVDAAGNKSAVTTVSGFSIVEPKDTTAPAVVISKPSPAKVVEGGTVKYTVTFSDETAMGNVNMTKNHVAITGFEADISVSGSGNTRTVTLANVQGAADANNTISVRANAAVDTAGNKSAVATSSAFTITAKDTIAPSVVISKPSPTTVVEGGTVKYTVTFSDETAMGNVKLNKDYVALIGFTADVNVSGSENTRTVTLSNIIDATGDNSIAIRAGAAVDAAGNKSAVATSSAFTITAKDRTAPSVVVSKPSPITVVEGGTVKYTVVFSDETAIGTVNFNANYVAVVGFTADVNVSGNGNTRTITLSNIIDATGDNSIAIRAGAAVDAAGNKSAVATSSAFTITAKDKTAPSVVISKPSPITVEEGGTVVYTVVFSDETAMGIINFNANYVAVTGFTADVNVSGSGNTRTVTLSNVQGAADTNNKIIIRAGAAVDATGNKSAVTESSEFTIKEVAKDITRPSIVISKPSPTIVEEGGTVVYTVAFSDETAMGTINFNANYVAVVGFTADVNVSGSGNTRTVILTNVQGTADSDNKIIIRAGAAADAAGNTTVVTESSEFTIKEVVKDTTVPSVVISKPSPTVVKVGETVSYTILFSDETAMGTINFNANYVALIGFTADISVTGSGNTRVVTLTNVQSEADSDNRIAIRAGAAVDAAGNKSEVAESSNFAITVPEAKDTTAPSIVISKPSPMIVEEGGTVKYTVVFSDETAMGIVNLNKDYVALIGFTADVSVSGNGTTREITLTNIQGTAGSDNKIAIRAGAAVDAAGNRTAVTESSNFTVKAAVKDTTAPSVVISKPSPAVVEVGDTVKYTVVFSDETAMGTVNFNKNYVELVGFTANVIVTGNGNTRTITLTDVKGAIDSDNRIIIKAGAAVDAAGNKSLSVESANFTIKETEIIDSIAPVVNVTSVKPTKVYANGTVVYTVTFADNIAVTDVNLYASKITTVGFKADISVKVNGVKSAEITLKNIKGTVGNNKYIKIASGVALDAVGNRSAEVTSTKFSIIKKASTTPTTPIKTVYTLNCIDDLELLGDINEEITYFASWLRAEKYTATYVQENNYVVEDDAMTYMVEYYNGSTAPAPDVKFELTIPYKVEVEEINGAGKITKRTDNETVITWNIGTVKSYVASQGTGFCRLYVRVKFLENKALEESDNISEVFYATLKTTAGGNESYSYMRQLFIDLTEGKTGTYTKYLTTIDSTNQVRPNDEITRAEFAKLLADAGIIEVEIGDKLYKTFKDYESIPSYARDAVSALLKTDIIQAFPDGTFKPNNPILVEDVMQMLAQAATYISEQKLTVGKPVFLYTDALKGKYGEVSPKKDYIMELMRQNVVVKYESNPDTYALRKDVVAMVNSLTFRGPYVETLPENTLKFADIREDSVVFYNIVGASNSYTYTYDYRLWQQIVDVE